MRALGFLALREMLEGKAGQGTTSGSGGGTGPINADPEEMGWRTTAQNLNLNRDYVKADAPEMQAMLRLLAEWDPILLADLHVTDGAEFEHDVSVNVAPTLAGDDELRLAGGSDPAPPIRRGFLGPWGARTRAAPGREGRMELQPSRCACRAVDPQCSGS